MGRIAFRLTEDITQAHIEKLRTVFPTAEVKILNYSEVYPQVRIRVENLLSSIPIGETNAFALWKDLYSKGSYIPSYKQFTRDLLKLRPKIEVRVLRGGKAGCRTLILRESL